MKQDNQHEEKIKALLQQMPDIEDKQDVDELYWNISRRLQDKRDVSPMKRKWVLPSLATAVAFFLIIFSTIFLSNNSTDQFSQLEDSADEAVDENRIEVEPEEESKPEVAESQNGDQYNTFMDNSESNLSGSSAVREISAQQQALTIYLPEVQYYNYLVPVTFLVDKNHKDFTDNLRRIEEMLPNIEPMIDNQLFADVSFNLQPEFDQVTVDIGERTFQGSSAEYLFMKALHYTFGTLGYKTLHYKHKGEEGVEFPHSGFISKENISMQNFIYKRFETEDGFQYLIPLEGPNNGDIDQALEMMREDEDLPYVYEAIPNGIEFDSVEENEDVLTIQLKNHVNEEEKMVTMIDAVLMTAKSFGFEKVLFDSDINGQSFGPYDLSKEITVPHGINFITELK
ncbi:hypothetical protein [Salirhabdus salicampi]|uniref:hypothetical protein n=1 Tax=Salirhabdus salicampi TaxID=476102 RepID=UPI0020C1BC02|nr:hypothetical protein [Salirhabdus salicampi]MCP8616733.1 hypothetical protein [Salirhabdus salicampi]